MFDNIGGLNSTGPIMDPQTFDLVVLPSYWPLKFSLSSQLMRRKGREKNSDDCTWQLL